MYCTFYHFIYLRLFCFLFSYFCFKFFFTACPILESKNMSLKFACRLRFNCIGHSYFGIGRTHSTSYFNKHFMVCSAEVENALSNRQPVVALESTIITHGMPYPDNLRTATEVESIVRKNGATPATIAIINGKIHIGLNQNVLESLAKPNPNVLKTSRRDLPYVISQKLDGGLTVSGTMIAAHRAGIPVFVTGGVGGVHRGAESTMDVSADLTELGRTPVAVVSAGVKSILDIGRTLEYLETQGVCVAAYGEHKDFPAFFTPNSGFKAPYNVLTSQEAAQMINSNLNLELGSGMLIAVPIPREYAASGDFIESAIQDAVAEAKKKGIGGKDVTPFILQKVNEITKGKSLEANIALIKNNAEIGSQIAVELSKLRENIRFEMRSRVPNGEVKSPKDKGRPVVVGGTNVDFTVSFNDENIKPNGATYRGQVKPSFGGVGRNLADCLTRLGSNPIFLSAVGVDSYADLFYQQCGHMDLSNVNRLSTASTATYCPVLRSSGQLIYGIGDFAVHDKIDKAYLSKYEDDISTAPIVVMDGNIAAEAMQYICDICHNAKVPVFFEPTDMTHMPKLFKSSVWKQLTYSSPNMNELRMFYGLLHGKSELINKDSGSNGDEAATLQEAVELSREILPYVPNLLVTLGEYGAVLMKQSLEPGTFSAVHYPVPCIVDDIVSVSGAGDCLSASVVSGLTQNISEEHYMKAGLLAAQKSLLDSRPVPDTISPDLLDIAHINKRIKTSYSPRVLQT